MFACTYGVGRMHGCCCTFGSCTKQPLLIGGYSPVVMYLRHSMMVWAGFVRDREAERERPGGGQRECVSVRVREGARHPSHTQLSLSLSVCLHRTVLPQPFAPMITVMGCKNSITWCWWASYERTPLINNFSTVDMLLLFHHQQRQEKGRKKKVGGNKQVNRTQ